MRLKSGKVLAVWKDDAKKLLRDNSLIGAKVGIFPIILSHELPILIRIQQPAEIDWLAQSQLLKKIDKSKCHGSNAGIIVGLR